MMAYRSDLKPFDVFYPDKKNDHHFYLCLYKQDFDKNNKLYQDAYGLFITTNTKYKHLIKNGKNDYVVPLKLAGKQCYVICDKITRMRLSEEVFIKKKKISYKNREKIIEKTNKFFREIKKQLEVFK